MLQHIVFIVLAETFLFVVTTFKKIKNPVHPSPLRFFLGQHYRLRRRDVQSHHRLQTNLKLLDSTINTSSV